MSSWPFGSLCVWPKRDLSQTQGLQEPAGKTKREDVNRITAAIVELTE